MNNTRLLFQVSWESGSTFTSDCFMVSRDAAYESAARNAVLSLQPGLRTDKVWYGTLLYFTFTSLCRCMVLQQGSEVSVNALISNTILFKYLYCGGAVCATYICS
jgi:hypothetical protein